MADFDTHKFIIFCLSILSIRLFIEVFNMNNHNSLIFRAVKTFLNYSIFVISYLSILILGGFAYFAAILVWPILYFFYYLLIIIFLHKRESFKIKIFVAHGLAFLFVLVYFIQGFLFRAWRAVLRCRPRFQFCRALCRARRFRLRLVGRAASSSLAPFAGLRQRDCFTVGTGLMARG